MQVVSLFSESPISPSFDAKQLHKLQKFKDKVSGLGGIYTPFDNSEDFVFKIRDYLTDVAHSYGKAWGKETFSPDPGQPEPSTNVGSLAFYDANTLAILLGTLGAFLKFYVALNINNNETRKVTTEMNLQFAKMRDVPTEADKRLAALEATSRVSTSLLKASLAIRQNLPKLRDAWGDLSALLFKLLTLQDFDSSASPQAAQDLIKKSQEAVITINKARASTLAIAESINRLSGGASPYSKQSFERAVREVANEYDFIADEFRDFNELLMKKLMIV